MCSIEVGGIEAFHDTIKDCKFQGVGTIRSILDWYLGCMRREQCIEGGLLTRIPHMAARILDELSFRASLMLRGAFGADWDINQFNSNSLIILMVVTLRNHECAGGSKYSLYHRK